MRQRIELITIQDIEEFISKINTVSEDVRLEGFDENGSPWQVSVKSTLGKLILQSQVQRKEDNTSNSLETEDKELDADIIKTPPYNIVDWNTIECVCNKDIYSLISKWAVGSRMEG